jgi:hypothetical protein
MGLIINKSYQKNDVSYPSFYVRIDQVTIEKMGGTAYAYVSYFKDKAAADDIKPKYTRETWERKFPDDVDATSLPFHLDAETLIGGAPFIEPTPFFDDFRTGINGFFFPIGTPVQVEQEFYDLIDTEEDQPFIDFDADGNPIQTTRKIVVKKKVVTKTETMTRTQVDLMNHEFLQDPYKFLYVRLKPELEKIFGAGSVSDEI